MDKITLIMFIGLSGFVFFLFLYILSRDKVIENKLAGLELSLEELNQEIFKIRKEVKAKNLSELAGLEKVIEEILKNVKEVEGKFEKLKELESRIEVLEKDKTKKIFDVPNISMQDEERIKRLYKNGYSIEEISKELRIPAGEIELVLKFSDFN